MGFAVPSTYPGATLYATPPNVIRASTMLNLIERDRYVYAYSRRLVASCSQFTTTSAVAQLAYFGSFKSAPNSTGKYWVCASGDNVNVGIQVNAGAVAYALATPFTVDAALVNGSTSPSTWYNFQVLAQTIVAGTGTLFGVYIVEERLASLP
jgi:hypothetical protein